MYVLYGGIATRQKRQALAPHCASCWAIVIYRMWSPAAWWQILRSTTRESVMI